MTAVIEKIARPLVQSFKGMRATDGADVALTRVIGTPHLNMLDPFLLLDVFETDEPKDYIGGFPPHPHRGFETVTYLLDGYMEHKDNAGHQGMIEPGGVQWMTAGKGVLHSEMPKQKDGLMKGFQLWLNLPAKDKMASPAYQEHDASEIPVEEQDNGITIKVIAGKTDDGITGPITDKATEPLYLDVTLPAHQTFEQSISVAHNSFIWIIEGALNVEGDILEAGHIGVLGNGTHAAVKAGQSDARFLLLSGKPLGEPVARGGPFVMNTKAEILQAFDDYNNGKFGELD